MTKREPRAYRPRLSFFYVQLYGIVYWKGDDCEEYKYRLSEAEKEMILPEMDAYCKVRTEMSLLDYSAKRIAEDQEITPAQPEQPKKPAVKKRQEER